MNRTLTIPRPTTPALAIRASVVPLAVIALLLVPHPAAGPVLLAVLGMLLAVTLPANAGSLLLVAALVLAWTVSYGSVATPDAVRTVLFALTVYLVHVAVACAASVPLVAHVSGPVIRAWLRHCVPGVVATVLAGALVAAVGRPHGSSALDVVGLLAAVTAAGAIVLLARLRG
jgi:hypothetical protein